MERGAVVPAHPLDPAGMSPTAASCSGEKEMPSTATTWLRSTKWDRPLRITGPYRPAAMRRLAQGQAPRF
jgi:hypothetical protein